MKKENINKIFESIASKYDLMNDLMSFGLHRNWKKKFIDLIELNLKKKNIILDLGCGTGDIFYEIMKKPFLNTNYSACLVDPNIEMMNYGIKKLKSKNLIWLASYGEKLPFKNNTFDLVTMSFSLRNVENINITLNEINRVLKKNGQFLCLEFGKVDNLAINTIYKIYSENLIPMIGKKVTGNKEAYEYLIESIKKFPSQKEICKFLNLKKSKKILKHIIYVCKKIKIKMIVMPLLEKSSVNKKKLNQFLKIMFEEIKNTNLLCSIEMDAKTSLKDKKRLFLKYFPKIGICYDTGNSIGDKTILDHEIITLGKLVTHLHLKDKIRIKKKYFNTYLGEGKLNFHKLKYALNKIKYRKKITFECYYSSSALDDAKRNMSYACKNLL